MWNKRNVTNRWFANVTDTVVVDKLQRRAVVIDMAFPDDCNIKKKEHEKLEKHQTLKKRNRKAVENQGLSDSGYWSIWCCEAQTGSVAPTDLRNNIRDLCPKE